MRLESDPSSIPLAALLSERYLDVPSHSNSNSKNNNNSVQPLGLTKHQRTHRLSIYGRNELDQPPERSLFSFIVEQFDDKLVRILLAVALASGILGLMELKEEMRVWMSSLFMSMKASGAEEPSSIAETVVKEAKARILGETATASAKSIGGIDEKAFGWTHVLEALVEPIVISTILVINALVGGYQSLNASKGISALKKMQAQKAVLRLLTQPSTDVKDSSASLSASVEEVEVDAATLVPGDIVVLSVGQKIPADIRLISVSTSTFTVDEASLTGESDSVPKTPYVGDIVIDEERDKEHRGHVMDDLDEIQEGVGSMGKHARGMLYSGTVITAGKGVGVVVRTAMSTEMGKVRKMCYIGECIVDLNRNTIHIHLNLLFSLHN